MTNHTLDFKNLRIEFETDDEDDHLVTPDLRYHATHVLFDTKKKAPLWSLILGHTSWRNVLVKPRDGDVTNFRRSNLMLPLESNRYFLGYTPEVPQHPDATPIWFLGQRHSVLLSRHHRELLEGHIERHGGKLLVLAGYAAHGYTNTTPSTPMTYLTKLLSTLDEVPEGYTYALLNPKHRWDLRRQTDEVPDGNLVLATARRSRR
jgi:hypothetical protein